MGVRATMLLNTFSPFLQTFTASVVLFWTKPRAPWSDRLVPKSRFSQQRMIHDAVWCRRERVCVCVCTRRVGCVRGSHTLSHASSFTRFFQRRRRAQRNANHAVVCRLGCFLASTENWRAAKGRDNSTRRSAVKLLQLRPSLFQSIFTLSTALFLSCLLFFLNFRQTSRIFKASMLLLV